MTSYPSGSAVFFCNYSVNDIIFGKNASGMNSVFLFSPSLESQTISHAGRTPKHVTTNVHGLSDRLVRLHGLSDIFVRLHGLSDCMDCPTDLSDDKIRLRISLQILNVSPHYKIFTQIRPQGNVLFYTDKRTAITKPPYVSRNFVSSPETTGNYQGSTPGLSPHQQQLWSHTQRVKRDFTAISNTPILKCKGHEYMEHYFHSPHTPSSQALSVFCSTVHTASTVGLHNSTATTVLRTKQASRRQLCSTGDEKQD